VDKSGSENWAALSNSFARLLHVLTAITSKKYKERIRCDKEFEGQNEFVQFLLPDKFGKETLGIDKTLFRRKISSNKDAYDNQTGGFPMKRFGILAAFAVLLISGCRVAIQPVIYPAPTHPPVIVVPSPPPVVGTPRWIPGHFESRCYTRPGGHTYCPRTWVPSHWE